MQGYSNEAPPHANLNLKSIHQTGVHKMKIVNYFVEKSKNGILVGLTDRKGIYSQGRNIAELEKNLISVAELNELHRVKLRRTFKKLDV